MDRGTIKKAAPDGGHQRRCATDVHQPEAANAAEFSNNLYGDALKGSPVTQYVGIPQKKDNWSATVATKNVKHAKRQSKGTKR